MANFRNERDRNNQSRPETQDEQPTDVENTTPPPGFREDPDWFKYIGPEDEDPDVIAENLEEYGFNLMDEDDFESDPVGPADMPDWTNEAVYGGDRPMMPDYPDAPLEDHLRIIDVSLEEDALYPHEEFLDETMIDEMLEEADELDQLDDEQPI